MTHAYSRREVDDSLFIKDVDGGDPAVVVRGSDPEFSKDSRWVAYYINPPEEEGGRGASWKRLRLTLGLRLGSPAAPLGPTGQNGAWLRVADRP